MTTRNVNERHPLSLPQAPDIMSESHVVTIAPNPIDPRKTLIPPLRFAIVEKNVYRGSYPRPLNFPFLESLKLKTILSLTPAPLIEPVANWCKQREIRIIHHPPNKSGKKSIPLSHWDAKIAVEVCCQERSLTNKTLN